MPLIVDLSHENENPPQFHELLAMGVEGVILKATQGVGFVDETFLDRQQRARSVGLLVGAYHFMDNTGSGEAQFQHYKSTVAGLELLHAQDWEQNPKTEQPYCPVDVAADFYARWLIETGKTSNLDYRPIGWYRDPNRPYWVPRYIDADNPGVGHWHLWQFSEHGFEGIPNDIDVSRWNDQQPVSLADWWKSMLVTL